MIITIDGPAGGGKSTAARNVARRLGIPFLDTGAMYRALTLKLLRRPEPVAPADLLEHTHIEVAGRDDRLRVRLDGEDVTDLIRTPEVTAEIGKVSGDPAVRAWMAGAQRGIARTLGRVVTEGRDQGTAVFPDADVKFYLVCDLDARARRRAVDFGAAATPDAVRRALSARDRQDAGRSVAPLRRPADAIIIDTTWFSPEQVADEMVDHIRRRFPAAE